MTYNTRQKVKIQKIIVDQSREFSMKDIYNELIRLGEDVGLTTIYRVADEMIEAGALRKNIAKDGQVRFQYLESCHKNGHCYLKCDQCGRLEHTDCHLVNELVHHVADEHGFQANEKDIIINGTCRRCAN